MIEVRRPTELFKFVTVYAPLIVLVGCWVLFSETAAKGVDICAVAMDNLTSIILG